MPAQTCCVWCGKKIKTIEYATDHFINLYWYTDKPQFFCSKKCYTKYIKLIIT